MILVDKPTHQITAEQLWFGLILHGNVFTRWTRKLRAEFRQDVRNIAKLADRPVYSFHPENRNPKLEKFIKQVGGAYDHTRTKPNGVRMKFYRFLPLD